MDVLQEEWEEMQEGPIPPSTYVTLLKGEAKRNSRVGKGDPHTGSSRPEVEMQTCKFKSGQQVLLLLLSSDSNLQVNWQVPYIIVHRRGKMDYEAQIPHKGIYFFHVNLPKAWTPREQPGSMGPNLTS